MKVFQDFSELFTPDGRVFNVTNELSFVLPTIGAAPPYSYTQVSPSSLWIVNHNLGYRPVIEILSDGGLVVEAGVAHISVNQTQISFNTPQTGTVIAR